MNNKADATVKTQNSSISSSSNQNLTLSPACAVVFDRCELYLGVWVICIFSAASYSSSSSNAVAVDSVFLTQGKDENFP